MLTVAENIGDFFSELRKDPAFQFAARSEDRILAIAERVGDREQYLKFKIERRKERFAALRGPFDLDSLGIFPPYSVYRSDFVDQLRAAATANSWRGVVDPTTRNIAFEPATQQEAELAFRISSEREAYASKMYSNATLRSPNLHLELLRLYEDKLFERGFTRQHRKGMFASYSRPIANSGLYFSLVDTSVGCVDAGSVEFAFTLQTQKFPANTAKWQFSVAAYYFPYDLSTMCGSARLFSAPSVCGLNLAAHCVSEMASRFAMLLDRTIAK